MRRVAVVVGALGCVLVGGCKRELPEQAGTGIEAVPAGGPTSGAAAPVVVEVVAPPAVRPAPPTVPPEVLALREARRLVKAGELHAAWEAIGPVARVNKSDGHLLCEAGFIGYRDGRNSEAEALLQRGIGLLSRDHTRPGKHGRAMCLYNLALVHEAAGTLGEAICALRKSEGLRANKTVAAKRRELEGKVEAAALRCKVERVASRRDVRELAREWGAAREMTITGVERETAGGFTIHVVRLATAEADEERTERYEDVAYVVIDDAGRLFPLGALGYADRSPTYFRGSASYKLAGFHPSPLGTLLLFELSWWYTGDSEKVESGYGISSHSRGELLVCRGPRTPDEALTCAQVPLEAAEEADAEVDAANADESSGTAADGQRGKPSSWGSSVSYRYDAVQGAFVFELGDSDADAAETLGLPIGTIPTAELFERYAEDQVAFDL